MAQGKSSWWSITINNPTDDDKHQWSSLSSFPWVKETRGQLEQGEEGTLHIQGAVRTEYGRFFNKLRAALPRAHVEVARNPTALQQYVVKEESRVGQITKIKTATQHDLQECMYAELLYHGNRYFAGWQIAQDYFEDNIEKYHTQILSIWETILDQAVRQLIRLEYFGIEFVVSNNQVRAAFRKYLPEILIRCHRQALRKIE